ncbi:sensor histidine kinase [Pedobacter sp. KBW06]|uniref:sensor histidine kinase n=1 Tax=Pedobacter sp. KBW06 TaxID=2153359 RepID=UPI001315514C|nr:ATP-binding protein [Pedobacter sp. KBW06]
MFSSNLSLLFLFFLLISKTTAGQSTVQAKKEFEKLAKAYNADRISADKYLDSAYSLTQEFVNEGIEFKTQELAGLLSLYKDIAWGKKEYGRPRVKYYMALADNAEIFGQTGAAMYYNEKLSEELAKNGKIRPLLGDVFKVKAFNEQSLYNKVISTYRDKKEYIQRLPEQLRNKKTENVNGMFAIDILAVAIEAYIKTKDTAAVYRTALLADQIGNILKGKYPINRQHMLYNDFYALIRRHDIALLENNQVKVGMLLDSIQTLKTTYKDQPMSYIEVPLFQMKVDHFLILKNLDSARFYIKQLESLPNFFKSQQPILDEYKAQLQAVQGDFQGGYTSLTSALAHERKAKAVLMAEMDTLLYAYTEAENTKIELRKSEKVKQQRTNWLVLISIASSIFILAIYLIMVYRSRKSRAQVEALNNVSNMQIIAMEEAKHQAVREEQQRLGQDLHDGLSSSIAAIKYQLEVLWMDTNDIALKNKLNTLRMETESAYKAARNKSHEWFSTADEQQELSFEKQIKLLTDSSLPDNRYNKTIHIDNSSLIGVGMDIRIALLRIIQEAITNIIKHARAKSVEILIYEEEDILLLTVNDDGIGLNEKKSSDGKSTMGLQSIHRRVQSLNGETKIHSDTKGTEITISIPLVLS